VLAQNNSDASSPAPISAPAESKQFDFLLGQWDVEAHPKISSLAAMIHGTPKLIGTWKAWRVSGTTDIEDELRVVDGSGNPISSNHTIRTYDPVQARWKISGRDVDKGRSSKSTAQLVGDEMHIEGRFTDSEGITLTRTRYYGISADSFHMTQDRSSDNGKTWDEGTLTIDAKRVAENAKP
jgi:hypothetical protein